MTNNSDTFHPGSTFDPGIDDRSYVLGGKMTEATSSLSPLANFQAKQYDSIRGNKDGIF